MAAVILARWGKTKKILVTIATNFWKIYLICKSDNINLIFSDVFKHSFQSELHIYVLGSRLL